MLFNAGSGEMIKASLLSQIYSVAICRNNAHKKMVWDNLSAFVRSMGLVNLTFDAPTKPVELVEFDKNLQNVANTIHTSVGPPLLRTPPREAPPLLRTSPASSELLLGADKLPEPLPLVANHSKKSNPSPKK